MLPSATWAPAVLFAARWGSSTGGLLLRDAVCPCCWSAVGEMLSSTGFLAGGSSDGWTLQFFNSGMFCFISQVLTCGIQQDSVSFVIMCRKKDSLSLQTVASFIKKQTQDVICQKNGETSIIPLKFNTAKTLVQISWNTNLKVSFQPNIGACLHWIIP